MDEKGCLVLSELGSTLSHNFCAQLSTHELLRNVTVHSLAEPAAWADPLSSCSTVKRGHRFLQDLEGVLEELLRFLAQVQAA